MRKIQLSILFYLVVFSCFAQNVQQVLPKIKDAIFTIYAEDEDGNVMSSGSGFFISTYGVGITNFHVLEGSYSAHIKDSKGNKFKISSVIDYNPNYDLVKFKINNANNTTLKSLKLSTLTPQQGEQIISYSTPLGLFENTVSTGIISSIREMPEYESVLQITAPISHGSSGSPIMNYFGEVVGVATFGCEAGQSLNFAVNVSQINKLTRNLNIKISDMRRNELETENVRKAYKYAAQKDYLQAVNYLAQELHENSLNHLALYYKGVYMCREAISLNAKHQYYNDLKNMGLMNLGIACILDSLNYDYIMHSATFCRSFFIKDYEELGHEINENTGFLMEEAFKYYDKAISINPNRYDTYISLGYFYFYVSRIFKDKEGTLTAKQITTTALNLGGNYDTESYIVLAKINCALGNFGEAILNCDDAINLNNKCYQAYLTRGDIKIFELQQINEGLIDLEIATALAENPRDKADVIGLKGTAYARKAMKEKCRTSALKALQYYEESLSIYPMPGVQADYENWKILSKTLLK